MYKNRMRTLLWMRVIMIFIILAVGVKSQAQYYQNSYALVVGIDKYQSPKWQKLNYAVRDAKSMASLLKARNFRVFELYDQQATRIAIIRKQNSIAHQLRRHDRVLVFFAGHGYTETIGNEEFGYIIPYDGIDTSNYISMAALHEQSRKMENAKHQLFIMDSCYGGLLGVRGGALDVNESHYLDDVTKRQARSVLMAGGKDQQVVDNGPGGHSVFTGALLEALKGLADVNNDGYIVFPELCHFVLSTAWNAYQTPACSSLPGHKMGEFVFRSPLGNEEFIPTPTVSTIPILRGEFDVTQIAIIDAKGERIEPVNGIYPIKVNEQVTIQVEFTNPNDYPIDVKWNRVHGDLANFSEETTSSVVENHYTAKKLGPDHVIVFLLDKEMNERLQRPITIHVVHD